MKKIALIVLGVWSVLAFAQAQEVKLSGKITDENGEALPGASVVVESTYLGTMSGDDGSYEISLQAGEYSIIYSYIGYESKTEAVSVLADKTVNISLKEKTYLGSEVIVEAIRASQESPFAQTTIAKEDLEKNNVNADIPFQLETTPSAVATSENGTGYGYSALRIRGTDLSRINITINGMPLNDPESQGVYFVNMPDFTASTSQVQIQRGVGTSSNGSAAFGASINFQTLGVISEPYATITTTVGSYNTFKKSIAAGTGLMNNKFAFDVRYSKLDSDGYIHNGFSDHRSFFASGAYVTKKSLLKANVILGEEHTGITWWGVPDYMIDSIRTYNPAGVYYDADGNEQYYEGQTDNYWQNHYQLFYSNKPSKQWNINASGFVVTGKGYYEQYKEDDEFSAYGLNPVLSSVDTIATSDIIRQKWLDNIYYGGNVSANYTAGRVETSVGAGYSNYNGDHFGRILWSQYNAGIPHEYEWYSNSGIKMEVSGFAKTTYKVSKYLSAYADVQVRSINYKMEGPDDDLVELKQEHEYVFVNPKVGVSYIPNIHHKLYASFGQANREPARADLKDAVKDGGENFPYAELLNNIEAGYIYKNKSLMAGANLYYMLYKDQLVNTGELNSVGYPIMTNVEDSYRAGVEFMYGYKFNKLFKLEGNTALSQNKILGYTEYAAGYDVNWNDSLVVNELGTTDISYSPNFVQAITWSIYPVRNTAVNLIFKSVGKQYIDNTSDEDRVIEAYSKLDLRLDHSWPYSDKGTINLQFIVNNLTNSLYNNNAYGGNWFEQGTEYSWVYYFPSAPTNYAIKVQMNF